MTSTDLDDSDAPVPVGPELGATVEAWSRALIALTALAGGRSEAVARFRYEVPTDTWWWSEEMFALHGFAVNEVTPTTELLLAHKHPEDRARTVGRLMAVLDGGDPFCCRHRIVDATGRVRTVLSLGAGRTDGAGVVRSVEGYFVDITDAVRLMSEEQAREAVQRSAESRADIEQAKGILIAAYGIDAEAAFHLLRWHSQHANIKLRQIAEGLVRTFTDADAGTGAVTPRRRAMTFLEALSRGDDLGTPG